MFEPFLIYNLLKKLDLKYLFKTKMEENRYLNNSDLNFESLAKEKKMAKVVIVLASIGVFVGFLASLTFAFQYKLIITPTLALLSGNLRKT